MTTFWMVAVLAVSQVNESPNTKPAVPLSAAVKSPESSKPIERSLAEWKSTVADALQSTKDAKDDGLDKATESLVNLYRDLAADAKLTKDDREKLREQLRGRLLTVKQNLLARIRKDQNTILAQQLPAARGVAGGNNGGNNAQGSVDHGKALVDLIQAVIAPQSWDVMGGPGSIRYWAPGAALIINQSGEAHEQMEDVLKQLRKN